MTEAAAVLTYPTVAKPRARRRRLWIVLGVIVLLVGGLIAGGRAMAIAKRNAPIPVTTDKAFRKNITQLVTATGKIQPEVEVKISPEVSGEIIDLPVVEGQFVHKGDLLLRIKPDNYQAQVEAQTAALNSARAASVQHRAELAKAKLDYERAEQLFKNKLISDTDRNAAQTTYEIAKATLESSLFEINRAEGALRQLNDLLSKTVIHAPQDGTISALESKLGERVVGTSQFAGTEVMRIADLSQMEAQVNVNENDIVNVKVGDRALISVDAYPERKIIGTVREIASTALTQNAGTQEEVTNFLVKIRITDHKVQLKPGMSATADVQTSTVDNAVVVPIQSVTVRNKDSKLSPEELEKQTNQQQQQAKAEDNRANVTNEAIDKQKQRDQREKMIRVVFIKDGDKVRQQKVETGINDNTFLEIKTGVKPGDEIVSGSYTAITRKLKDGAKVTIEKPGQS